MTWTSNVFNGRCFILLASLHGKLGLQSLFLNEIFPMVPLLLMKQYIGGTATSPRGQSESSPSHFPPLSSKRSMPPPWSATWGGCSSAAAWGAAWTPPTRRARDRLARTSRLKARRRRARAPTRPPTKPLRQTTTRQLRARNVSQPHQRHLYISNVTDSLIL